MATADKNSKKQDTQSSTGEVKNTNTKQKTLTDMFENGLKHIYSGETQLVEALPKVAHAIYSEELQDAVKKHLEQTKRHVERLEKIFKRLGIEKSQAEKCKVMEMLIEEGNKIIEEYEEGHVRDSALIIAAQKIEHHEIAVYGSLVELADVLGEPQIMDLLDRTLQEEETTDKTLTHIAMDVNDDACEMSEEEVYEDA